jgi:hypothetical protein
MPAGRTASLHQVQGVILGSLLSYLPSYKRAGHPSNGRALWV